MLTGGVSMHIHFLLEQLTIQTDVTTLQNLCIYIAVNKTTMFIRCNNLTKSMHIHSRRHLLNRQSGCNNLTKSMHIH